MENNLEFYDRLKSVPKECLKTIQGGRLKGMTDIKPQWRVMIMTEVFGPCGVGWCVENVTFDYKETNNVIVCDCSLELLVKIEGEWSRPIVGVGGSMLVEMEKNGPYVSDEARKMAYTDALSVAMKMLGVAGDVYIGLSDSKYSKDTTTSSSVQNNQSPIKRKLGQIEVEKKWNGKIYKGKLIYIDNRLIEPPTEQLEKLKNHEKYTEE